jgi:hypothetical protein
MNRTLEGKAIIARPARLRWPDRRPRTRASRCFRTAQLPALRPTVRITVAGSRSAVSVPAKSAVDHAHPSGTTAQWPTSFCTVLGYVIYDHRA